MKGRDNMPFIARYWSTDPHRTMLGGGKKSESSRFETREQAELRLQSAISIHAELTSPLAVVGEVVEVNGPIDIFSDGSVRGGKWGKAKEAK